MPTIAVLTSSPEASSFAVATHPRPAPVVVDGRPPASVPIITAQPGPPGPEGGAGPSGPQGPPAGQLTFIAGAILSGHRTLMIQPDDTAVHADPNAPGYVFASISLGAAQAGAVVVAEDDGQIVEPSWSWSPGLPLFALSGGLLSQTVPLSGVVHLIGFAVNSTTLRVAPQPPISIV